MNCIYFFLFGMVCGIVMSITAAGIYIFISDMDFRKTLWKKKKHNQRY